MDGNVSYEITPEEAAQVASIERKVVPGRSCGTCSLCCKVLTIPLFNKPAGQWCTHAKPGKGCGIHLARPFVCRSAFCEWMIAKGLGEEWKPERAKFALFVRNNGMRITAHLDPGAPNAWKREPYYTNFKRWALEGGRKTPIHMVDVMLGERLTVVLPDREIAFGVLRPDQSVQMERHADGTLNARLVSTTRELEPA